MAGSNRMWRLASFCTHEMLSTPPATITGTLSTMMRCAAIAIACRPDEQKRLMDTPVVVTGKPARSAATRATLPPVVPSSAAAPRITSSTSAGSTPARLTACSIECAASVAPYVMLKAPFQLLASPVRAVERMTTSFMVWSWRSSVEGLAGFGELQQQRRRLPRRVVALFGGKALQRAHDVGQSDYV